MRASIAMISILAAALSAGLLFSAAPAQIASPEAIDNAAGPTTNAPSAAQRHQRSVEILPNVAFGDNISTAFSRNLKHLLTGGSKGTVQLWDAETGRLVRIFKEESAATRAFEMAVAMSPDGNRILAADRYGLLHVWDTLSGEILRKIDILDFVDATAWIVTATFLPDGNFITGGADRVIVWSASTGRPIH